MFFLGCRIFPAAVFLSQKHNAIYILHQWHVTFILEILSAYQIHVANYRQYTLIRLFLYDWN